MLINNYKNLISEKVTKNELFYKGGKFLWQE